MSDRDKIKCLADNSGNMVFDNALGSIIKGEEVFSYTVPEALKQYDRFVTTSYIWIGQNEPVRTAFSKVGNKPYIPMSVGLQAADYDKNFVLHPSVVKELKAVSERCVVGCRGYYTAEILNKYGIKNTMVIGCPSVYTNMFADWKIKKSGLSKESKTSANFMTFWRVLKDHEQGFLLYAYENKMDFVEQTSAVLNRSYIKTDPEIKDEIVAWTRNGNIFYRYNEWSDFIKQYDFSIGYRFHGNVIALNNHVPALFIYSDSRVRELCEFFKFPVISAEEFDPSKPLEYWYEKADYSEFNKTQDERIRNFREFCHKNGLVLKDEKDSSVKTENLNKKNTDSQKDSDRKDTVKKDDLSKDKGSSVVVTSHSDSANAPYECNGPWKMIGSDGKLKFVSDGKTTCKHLRIRLPETLLAGNEYTISFKTSFKTDANLVRFFLFSDKGKTQDICCAENKCTDKEYNISCKAVCTENCTHLVVTSTDFTGENYFTVSDINNIRANENSAYLCEKPWEKIKSDNVLEFRTDGKTIWKHLKIQMPEKMISGKEYFISFKTKFRTDSENVRFYLQGSGDGFQDLCTVKNRNSDNDYEISTCVLCEHDLSYLRVTSTDFTGENFIEFSDIDVRLLTVKNNTYIGIIV